jgi:hypothetical protein
MATQDLIQQELRYLYQPSTTTVEEVDVPPLHVLTLEGRGSPGSPQHIESAGVLFSLSQTIKFLLEKQRKGLEYMVMPLEGLWWTSDDSDWLRASDENRFWKLLMVQPEDVSEAMVEEATKAIRKQKPSALLSNVRFEMLHEGRSAQLLHIGPYSEEERTVKQILAWIKERGGTIIGKHHEIYLDDGTKTPLERVRTILRYPFS